MTRKLSQLLGAGLLAWLVSLSSLSPARAGGIAPDLERQIRHNPTSGKQTRVIVRFARYHVDGDAVAHGHRGQVAARHALINGATMTVPQNAVAGLTQDPNVAWVSPDRPVGAQWDCGVPTIGADQVWNNPGYDGSGVRVAVLDTGVYPSSDLSSDGSSRVVAWQDFVKGSSSPYDDNGHGTHVAGIVLGSGKASNGLFSGVAPAAELVAVKVLDQNGAGTVSTVINGLNWCVQNASAYNIRVINLSLGHDPAESYKTDPLCAAVRSAVKAGIVVVCAAGNKGKNSLGQTVYGGIECPGNEPSAITVGAENTNQTSTPADDTVCTYSSRGPTYIDHLAKPDLVAPGNKIVSLRSAGSSLDTTYPANQVAPSAYGSTAGTANYFLLSGTSMAAPQVAGTAALMLEANPNLGPESVKGILMYTALPLSLTNPLTGLPLSPGLATLTQGAGCVNAAGAVEVAGKVNPAAAVGAPWLTAPLSKQTTIAGTPYAWSQQVLWGSQVLWGDALMST
jgi:serine protease AprX